MKKKILACLLLSATTLFAITGCGNESGGGSGEVDENGVTTDDITLTYWHYEDETTINLLAEAFMEKYPNITVETRLISDMSTDLSAAATAGTFPDVFAGTDVDTALANQYWRDITEYWNNDPENQNLMATINEYGIGCFDTNVRYAAPVYYQPSAMFVDKNVVETLNLTMPDTDWTWAEMVDFIKTATQGSGGDKYYGLGYYNRLDSLYGIAAVSPDVRRIKGEFGFNGTDYDLSYWAIGEQEFSDLKLAGYVAPLQGTMQMFDWLGDPDAWFGNTGHAAVASEGFWTFQNIWNTTVDGVPYQEKYGGTDWIPYVTPNVVDEKEHNVIGSMYLGGVSTSCQHPYEAYLLLKFMGWGVDGWMARMDIYEDESITNASNVPLKSSNMPVPLNLDKAVWDRYKALFPQDDAHRTYWDDYFNSITRPVPFGWQSIAGYWNFCDQYFNKIGIHDLVDNGSAQAADYVEEATRQANYYHAEAMISYFGPSGYGILSDEEVAQYQTFIDSFTQ